ncbi:hypothetical protein T265_05602 [Opisthorchis viverrini]|uniref:Uncharacterized protein n=1 Tax=Opisthorchis viverrini TaxID=6198 RepID=A0A074ZNJ6_OPIVI|nr:hypothetical protein T265_05602 [Opisthorchis viverrini]KER27357.1 hypothetical protein T265_05602 [Opisthorchis viverrini]
MSTPENHRGRPTHSGTRSGIDPTRWIMTHFAYALSENGLHQAGKLRAVQRRARAQLRLARQDRRRR